MSARGYFFYQQELLLIRIFSQAPKGRKISISALLCRQINNLVVSESNPTPGSPDKLYPFRAFKKSTTSDACSFTFTFG